MNTRPKHTLYSVCDNSKRLCVFKLAAEAGFFLDTAPAVGAYRVVPISAIEVDGKFYELNECRTDKDHNTFLYSPKCKEDYLFDNEVKKLPRETIHTVFFYTDRVERRFLYNDESVENIVHRIGIHGDQRYGKKAQIYLDHDGKIFSLTSQVELNHVSGFKAVLEQVESAEHLAIDKRNEATNHHMRLLDQKLSAKAALKAELQRLEEESSQLNSSLLELQRP